MIEQWHPRLVVAALVALLVAAGQLEAWMLDAEDSPRLVLVGCALVATAAMGLWWRAPEISAAAAIGAIAVKDAAGGPGEMLALLVCGVLATFGVGLRLSVRRSRWGLLGLMVLASAGVLSGPESAPSELVFSAIVIVLPWGAGRLLRASRHHTGILEELAASREREAADQSRLAAADERERIAREVHDLVGHSVSTMILQAGAAEEVLARSPEDARASLQAVQSTGRNALDDLHGVLGLLRGADRPDDISREPVPGLDRLDALVETFRLARIEVECEVTGPIRDLPEGISLAAYRIVQECLTNVSRHAPSARACVRIERSVDELRIEVVDDGPGLVPTDRSGQGLRGIRDRVLMYDGELEALSPPAGGFRVAVRLPLRGMP